MRQPTAMILRFLRPCFFISTCSSKVLMLSSLASPIKPQVFITVMSQSVRLRSKKSSKPALRRWPPMFSESTMFLLQPSVMILIFNKAKYLYEKNYKFFVLWCLGSPAGDEEKVLASACNLFLKQALREFVGIEH